MSGYNQRKGLGNIGGTGYVKSDGSVPFIEPQEGVIGINPNDLVTLSQLTGGSGGYYSGIHRLGRILGKTSIPVGDKHEISLSESDLTGMHGIPTKLWIYKGDWIVDRPSIYIEGLRTDIHEVNITGVDEHEIICRLSYPITPSDIIQVAYITRNEDLYGVTGPTGDQGIPGPIGPTGPTGTIDILGFVKDDGTVPFIEPQGGVFPILDHHLTTKKWVEDELTPPCIETSWIELPNMPANQWRDIKSGKDNTWIAISDSGTNRLYISTDDGGTWNLPVITVPENKWKAIATDNNGTWIAVADSGSHRFIRSVNNGSTWTSILVPEIGWKAIATDNNGTWIAIANTGTDRIYRSTNNGEDWIGDPNYTGAEWSDIETDGNGIWIIVSSITGTTLRSIDNGLTWNPITGPGKSTSIVTDQKGVWIACGNSNSLISRSVDDGLTWTSINGYDFISIATDTNGLWVAVQSIVGGNGIPLITSNDNGLTWNTPSSINSTWRSIATNKKGTWIAVAYSGDDIYAMTSNFICPSKYVKDDGSVPFKSPQKGVKGIDNSDLIIKSQLGDYVKSDGTTPFTGPQEGIAGTGPNHLATVSQLPSPVDTSEFIKKDGSTPFEGPQEGIDAEEPNHLITLGQVENMFNLPCSLDIDIRSDIDSDDIIIKGAASGNNGVWIAFGNAYTAPYTKSMLKSIDDGKTWERISSSILPYGKICSNGENLWIHHIGKTIRLSSDGTTWGNPFDINSSAGGYMIHFKKGTSEVVAIKNSIHLYSSDGGLNWVESYTNIPSLAYKTEIQHVVDSIWVCNTNTELYKSLDNGITWNFASSIPSYSIIGVSENRIISKTYYSAFFYSDNIGDSWTPINAPDGYMHLLKSDNRGNWIAFRQYQGNDDLRLLFSYDNGLTWEQVYMNFAEEWDSGVAFDMEVSLDGTFLIMAIESYSSFRANSLAVVNVECVKYVKTDGSTPFEQPQKGVPGTEPNHLATVSQLPTPVDTSEFVKKDGSTPFTGIQKGIDPEEDDDLTTQGWVKAYLNPECLFNVSGILKSDLQQNGWKDIDTDDNGTWLICGIAQDDANTLMRSSDDGVNWSAITIPANFNGIAIACNKSGIWLCHGTILGVQTLLKSTDNGLTFNAINAISNTITKLRFKPNLDIVIASTTSNEMYRSVDAGNNWASNYVGFVARDLEYIGEDEWIANNSLKIYHSIDDGANWSILHNLTSMGRMAVGESTIVYSGNGNSGLLVSINRGTDWSTIPFPTSYGKLVSYIGNDSFVMIGGVGGENKSWLSTDKGLNWEEYNTFVPNQGDENDEYRLRGSRNGTSIAIFDSLYNNFGTYVGSIQTQMCPASPVLEDGTTPFTAPQVGVEGTLPNHLATVSQLPAPVDTSEFVKKDGSTPFTGIQKGIGSVEDDDLTTQGWVKEYLNSKCYLTSQLLEDPVIVQNRWTDMDSDNNGTWIICGYTQTNSDLLIRSTDDGSSWMIPVIPNGFIPSAISNNFGGTWICSGKLSGIDTIIKSTDNGETFNIVNGVNLNMHRLRFKPNSGTILGQSDNVVYLSTDYGDSWVIYNNSISGYFSYIDLEYVRGNTWILSNLNNIYISVDDGNVWNDISPPMSTNSGIAVNGNVCLVIGNSVLYRTTDDGNTWQSISTSLSGTGSIAALGVNSFIITYSIDFENRGTLYSYDAGLTWESAPTNTKGPFDSEDEYRLRGSSKGVAIEIIDTWDNWVNIYGSIYKEDCGLNYVKDDGSTPFKAPQVGVEGTQPNHLATVSQINSGGTEGNINIHRFGTITGKTSITVGAFEEIVLTETDLSGMGGIPTKDWIYTGDWVHDRPRIYINGLRTGIYVVNLPVPDEHEIVCRLNYIINSNDVIQIDYITKI